MLEAMGYKHTGRTTMVLDGPVDPDRVTCVSRDSLIALVECQVRPIHLFYFLIENNANIMKVFLYFFFF